MTNFTIKTFNELLIDYKAGVDNFLIEQNLNPVEKFDGGAYYLAFYPIAQQIINLQALFNEKLTELYLFPTIANQVISRNNSLEDTFIKLVYETYGVEANFRPITEETAGRVGIAVNFTTSFIDTTANRSKLFHLMNENIVAGIYFDGTGTKEFIDRTEYALYPAQRITRDVKIEYRVKKYNDYPVLNPQQIKELFLKNFNTKYALGVEFSNEEYLSYQELPFASFINFKLINPASPQDEVNAPISFAFNERLEIRNVDVVELV